MKAFRVSIVALVLVALGAACASAEAVSYGAKIGLSMTNVTGLPDEWKDHKSYRTGFAGGVFLNYAFDAVFSLQPELLYIQKGVVGDLYDGVFDVEATPKLDYIEIPVLLKVSFGGESKFRPCVFAGPSLAIATSSELEISAGFVSTDVDISSLTSSTDFGIVAGAGIGYDYGRVTFVLDARYQHGFSNLIESGELDFLGDTQTISIDEFKNYGFAVLAGVQF